MIPPVFIEWVQFEEKYNPLILDVGLGDSSGYNWIVLYSENAVSRRTSLLCSSWCLESLEVSLGSLVGYNRRLCVCLSARPPSTYPGPTPTISVLWVTVHRYWPTQRCVVGTVVTVTTITIMPNLSVVDIATPAAELLDWSQTIPSFY